MSLEGLPPPPSTSLGTDSNIVTLEPFSTSVAVPTRGVPTPKDSKKFRKGKNKKVSDNRSVEVAPGLYEPNDYDKYLTVVLDDTEVDIFDVHRDLVDCCGKEPTVYAQGSGRLLIEASSPAVSRKLQDLTLLGGVTATCAPHASMNKSRGIVYAPQLARYPEDKLCREFASQGVSEVRRLTKMVNGAATPLPQLVLTFDRLSLPEYIRAAWYRYKVRAFVPRPRRCFHCQEFGHTVESCRRKSQGLPPLCVNCGQDAHGDCTSSPRCVHCGGDHPSSSKQCDMFLFENEVQSIRVSDRLPYREARSKALSNIIRPGISYAKVVADSKMSRKHKNVPQPSNNISQYAPRMKRSRSKESVNEPPAKVQSTLLSTPEVSGVMPAVAGPSASSEAASAEADAFVPSGITSLVCIADINAADGVLASSEAVVASGDHSCLPTMNDSLEAEPEIFGSCSSFLDPESGEASGAAKTQPSHVTSVVNTPAKPPASKESRVVTKPKNPPSRKNVPQTTPSTSAASKAKPSSTKKVDKSTKRLSRDSPLAGRKHL